MPRTTNRCAKCRERRPKADFGYYYIRPRAERRVKGFCPFCVSCQRKIVAERENDPDRKAQYVAKAYRDRDRVLKSIGFACYKDYLASALWAGIRRRVLDAANWTCCACGSRASQVHHQGYGTAVLLGKSLKQLRAVCRDCHKAIEFDETGKRDIREVGLALYERAGTKPKSAKDRCGLPQWDEARRRQEISRVLSPEVWLRRNEDELRRAGIDPRELL